MSLMLWRFYAMRWGWICGDVNIDSMVNVFDALLVLQYAVGLYHPVALSSSFIVSSPTPCHPFPLLPPKSVFIRIYQI